MIGSPAGGRTGSRLRPARETAFSRTVERLTQSFSRRLSFAVIGSIFLLAGPMAAAAEPARRELTQAIEVRSLSAAEAAGGLPARLRGVVVFVESPTSIFFLQDETSTTFFRLAQGVIPPAVGDEIEVMSKTRMGLYMPGLDFSVYRTLGRRELPAGIPVQFDDLHFGRYHYQRVTVEGVVRSVHPRKSGVSVLRLAMGSRVMDVRFQTPPPAGLSPVDCRVRITGLAAGQLNAPRRQLVQPHLRAANWEEVAILSPAAAVAEIPRVSAADLLAFRLTGLGERRVRIDGVVAAVFGGDQVFLEQDGKAFAVRFNGPESLAPGDRVDVAGFPEMERFSAAVVDAELLARTPGPAPAALQIAALKDLYVSSADRLPGKYDGHLVQVVGTIREAFKSHAGVTLLVQDEGRTVQVRMPPGGDAPAVGSKARFTGICQVEAVFLRAGSWGEPGLINLHVASPAGFELLRAPPWWTARRLGLLLAALLGVMLLAGGWIAMLRRQVRRQTAALRHRIETEAALGERHRIAREFHDTLEQELAGVSLRLDALATRVSDEKGKGLVGASRNLVSRMQTETRDLVSDLRDPAETAGDLIAALESMAARCGADGEVTVRIAARTALPPFPAGTVHDLRMIAREAVNNARKHGRATLVTVELESRAERLTMRIVDDGAGFDAATLAQGKRGHFGCVGMSERGRKIGAAVAWKSAPQRGTEVEVTLPLSPSEDLLRK